MVQSLPEPPDAGVLNAFRFGTQTFRFIEGIQARFEDATSIPIPGRPPLVVLTNPDLVREALSRPADFPRVPAGGAAALIAERGLVQSEGDLWRQQRSTMGPAFTGRQVAAYADTVGRRVAALAETWAEAGGKEVDLHREMTSLTVRVASEVLLGEDIGAGRARQFHEWMRVAGAEFEFGIGSVTPDWLPERVSPAFREAAEGIRGLAEDLIEGRRAALAAGNGDDRPADMLSMLIAAEDDPDVEFLENQVRDEVATFLIAGHETTALSLSYTLSLLSWHPEIREGVREEAARVLDGDPPTYADVGALELTNRVYREALRLYPPAWAVFRRADGDVALGDYLVQDGSAVVMPQWSIHRDGRYFEDPTAFDPARWERRDPGAVDAYFPFSTGPHACIGRSFALSGATLSLARIVRDFDVDVPESELDDLRVTPTLRPADGIRATVEPAG